MLRLRRDRAYVDKLRAYKLFVDDVEAGSIKQGETLALNIGRGPHRIRLGVDWCSSPELTVDGGGDIDLVCRPAATPVTAIFYALFLRKAYIDLRLG